MREGEKASAIFVAINARIRDHVAGGFMRGENVAGYPSAVPGRACLRRRGGIGIGFMGEERCPAGRVKACRSERRRSPPMAAIQVTHAKTIKERQKGK